jgi:hypothetical protein
VVSKSSSCIEIDTHFARRLKAHAAELVFLGAVLGAALPLVMTGFLSSFSSSCLMAEPFSEIAIFAGRQAGRQADSPETTTIQKRRCWWWSMKEKEMGWSTRRAVVAVWFAG